MSLFDPRNLEETVTNPSTAPCVRGWDWRLDRISALFDGERAGGPDPPVTMFLSTTGAFFRTFPPSPSGGEPRRLAHSETVDRVEPDPGSGAG